jgi:O-antigen/teichoic acid export membrane protein
VLVVYLALVTILVTPASLRFEQALPLSRSEREASALLLLCVLLVAGTTALGALGLHLARGRVMRWMGQPGLGPCLWLVPVSTFGAGLYQVFNCWAIRKERYDRIARTRVTQSLTQILVQVLSARLGALGLLAGDAVGRSNGTRTLAMVDWRRDWGSLRRVRRSDLRCAAWRYREFPLLSGGTAVLNTFNLRMPGLLLAICYGPSAAGCFALAQRVFALPSAIIGESVAQVFFGESARVQGSLMPLFRATVRRMFLLGLGVMGLSSLAGWFLVPVIFGSAWKASSFFLLALTPMTLAQFSGACVSSALVVLERQDLALLREAVRTGLFLGGMLAAWLLRWDARGAVVLFGMTGTLAYGLYAWITWYAIRRRDAVLEAAP